MVASELGYDEEEVFQWPMSRLRRWLTFFRVKQDLENEAYAKARAKAQREAQQNRGRQL